MFDHRLSLYFRLFVLFGFSQMYQGQVLCVVLSELYLIVKAI